MRGFSGRHTPQTITTLYYYIQGRRKEPPGGLHYGQQLLGKAERSRRNSSGYTNTKLFLTEKSGGCVYCMMSFRDISVSFLVKR